MAEIRCPNCGRDNPESLTACQFCQTPLPPASTVQIGQKPTKKDTGELEPVLPDWLREVRRQAQDAADETDAASLLSPKKEEPPDLLEGLAFQSSGADEEDIPDWLSGLTPKPETRPSSPVTPAETGSDLLSRLEGRGTDGGRAPVRDAPSFEGGGTEQPSPSPKQDELSEWLSRASEQPGEEFALEPDEDFSLGWDAGEQARPAPAGEPSATREEEDLSWLRSLEEESKRSGEHPGHRTEFEAQSPSPASAPGHAADQEDLSWLNSLGSLPAPGEPTETASGLGEDLSWLDQLEALPPSDVPAQTPARPEEELSWLDDSKAAEPGPQEDLSWLDDLKNKAEASAPSGGTDPGAGEPAAELPHVSPFTPRRTAPLEDQPDAALPEWLKSATEEPSMPLGPRALDQFREDYKIPTAPEEPFSWKSFMQGIQPEEGEDAGPGSDAQTARPELFTPPGETPALSNQEVDSLFSVDMPDWLSSAEPPASEPAEEIGIHAEGGEALAPVDLPSWVQAMRPVEAVISDAVPAVDDRPAEREGPLAGFPGVIPAAPIGSSRRPQPVPLKLQASEEQQAGAGILEQLLLEETTPGRLVSAPVVISQRMLRWAIAALLLVVLGAVISLRTQVLPVAAPLAGDVTDVVMSISDNAPVLVVLDYEPALAGEMEAVSGPLLDQLVFQQHPHLSFVATSPNGTALVERLLANTGINRPGGHAYLADQDYVNLGYLPGGESGVLAFLQSPLAAIPSSPVLGFSEYAAVILLTDHADSARVWVEQLEALKQADPSLAGQPLLAVASAQTGPLLQPYVGSRQIHGMISGLADAARYEFMNGNRPGMARSYWDAFGIGTMMAIVLIVLGSLWSVFTGLRERRLEEAAED